MKAALPLFIFLIILGSASAEIVSITSTGGVGDEIRRANSVAPNIDIDDESTTVKQINIRTQPGNVFQSFASPLDPALTTRGVLGTITFKRSPTNPASPPIAQYYFIDPVLTTTSTGPTGAVIAYTEVDKSPLTLSILLFLAIGGLFLVTRSGVPPKSKIVVVVVILLATGFFSFKTTGPTGLVSFEEQSHVLNAFTVTWPGGGPVTFLQSSATGQCSDGKDNDGDGLTDCDDPGCHSDGDPTNPASCVPTDGMERDMLEYDHAPTVDGEIDAYDQVNFIQYLDGDTTVLRHCIDATCSNQVGLTNCIGDTDPNNDALISAADIVFLQTTDLGDVLSIGAGICFTPT